MAASTAATKPEPGEYVIKVPKESVVSIKDPYNKNVQLFYAYIPIHQFPHGLMPDDINPRSHDHLPAALSKTIGDSVEKHPKQFHLLNRGVVIIAKEASYDARSEKLSIEIPDADRYGMVDGATTDRTLARLKKHLVENIQTTEPNIQSFEQLKPDELPPYLQDAVVRVEIIAGDIGELIVPLAAARNTSKQVEEFTLENLDGSFTWIKESIAGTEFENKIRFRENDPEPFEVRNLLSLLTLFHPRWTAEGEEPTVAYTAKGQVLTQYTTEEWKAGYVALKNVLPDILRLYDYIEARFPGNYQGSGRRNIKNRKVIKHYKRGFHHLKLTGAKVEYRVPDALVFPILGAFRALLEFPNGAPARWQVSPAKIDPFQFWDDIGRTMVDAVMSTAKTLKDNPLQVGKFKGLWKNLHETVEMRKMRLNQGEKLKIAAPPIIHDPEVRLKLAKQK